MKLQVGDRVRANGVDQVRGTVVEVTKEWVRVSWKKKDGTIQIVQHALNARDWDGGPKKFSQERTVDEGA